MSVATPLWETRDGQLWLAKALDPAGFAVDLKGMPDQESHNVVVLNYQSQFSIAPPNMYNAEATDASTFETEAYFFEHPYVFGVAASYPSGTIDPLENSSVIAISFGAQGLAVPYIKFNSVGSMFPRTCTNLINTQIAGNSNVKQTFNAFARFAQKHRVIYGAAQCIPTCSAQDNSGSISVSQQPFVPDDGGFRSVDCCDFDVLTKDNTIGTGNLANADKYKFGLRVYRKNDFPAADDTIRNPASFMTRFYEGAYIPYKLKNPFQEDFISSDAAVTHAAPFWTVGASYLPYDKDAWVPMVWDVKSNAFTSPLNIATTSTTSQTRENVFCRRLCLTVMTKLGQMMDLIFINNNSAAENAETEYTCSLELSGSSLLNNQISVLNTLILDCPSNRVKKIDTKSINGTVVTNHTEGLTVYRMNHDGAGRPIVPLPNDNIISVICKAMNMRGNIQVLIRMGIEIQVSGASAYSPFNHKSPEYDESALKSYLRIVHRMSDAFYGNAASEAFRASYFDWLMAQLYNPPEGVDFANRGSYWRGPIRVD